MPDYDKYFDIFAKEFGEKNKCKVEVDYVATPDLPTAITARRDGRDAWPQRGKLLFSKPLRGEGRCQPCSHPGACDAERKPCCLSQLVGGRQA